MDETGVSKQEPMSVEDVRGWFETRVREHGGTEGLRPRVRRVGVLLAEIDRLLVAAEASGLREGDLRCLVRRWEERANAGMVVTRWDVSDGGVLGAIILCTACRGDREVRGCLVCDGTGELHRPYDFERYKASLTFTPEEPGEQRHLADTASELVAKLDARVIELNRQNAELRDRERRLEDRVIEAREELADLRATAELLSMQLSFARHGNLAKLAGDVMPEWEVVPSGELRAGDVIAWGGDRPMEVVYAEVQTDATFEGGYSYRMLTGGGTFTVLGGRYGESVRLKATDEDDEDEVVLRAKCPDDGTCHHDCDAEGPCWRVLACGPLSGVYPGDEWPIEITMAHRYEQSMRVPDDQLPEVGSMWESGTGESYHAVIVEAVDRPWVVLTDVVDKGQPTREWRTNLGAFLAGWENAGHAEEGCTAEDEFLADHPVFTEAMVTAARQDVPFWPNPLRWLRHEILVWRIAFNPDLPNDGMILGKLIAGTCRQPAGSPIVDDATAGEGAGVAIRKPQRGDRGLLAPNPNAAPANALVVAWAVGSRLRPWWLSPQSTKVRLRHRVQITRLGAWWMRRRYGVYVDEMAAWTEATAGRPLTTQSYVDTWLAEHEARKDSLEAAVARFVHGLDDSGFPTDTDRPTLTEWLRASEHEPTQSQWLAADVLDAAFRVHGIGRGAGTTWLSTRLVEWLNEVEPFAVRSALTSQHPETIRAEATDDLYGALHTARELLCLAEPYLKKSDRHPGNRPGVARTPSGQSVRDAIGAAVRLIDAAGTRWCPQWSKDANTHELHEPCGSVSAEGTVCSLTLEPGAHQPFPNSRHVGVNAAGVEVHWAAGNGQHEEPMATGGVFKGVASMPPGGVEVQIAENRHQQGHHRSAAEEAAVRSYADRQGDLR